jgi:energy-coupling factor transporter transmembrane protein EcfT
MKARLPQPIHESYKKHRRELGWQIILPVALSAAGFIALIVLIYFATFEGDGDVSRWAAISTIWIVIPVMLAGLILLALIGGLVYLMKRLLNVAPTYTGMAQDYVHKAAGYVKRGADMAVKPVLFLDGVGAGIRTFFGRK